MIAEHDAVVLTTAIAEHGLQPGDVGTVVHAYPADQAYEVEFVAGDGSTVAVVTVGAGGVRPVAGSEILHVRNLPAST